MAFLSVLPSYILWHYSRAFLSIFKIWTNFQWFIFHFFSIPTLFRTLLSPWKRLTEERGGKPLDFENIVGPIIVNTLMRLIGAIVRLTFIVIGLLSYLIVLTLGVVFIFAWIFAPLIIFYFITNGLLLIFLG